MDPLVVTLALDEAATARFDAERRELFPPGRTAVGAHLTLFHAVPGELVDTVLADVEAHADRDPFPVPVTEVMSLGRGVAYRLASSELAALHRTLQRSWWDHLTAQDRQGFRAHITVQNKVDPDTARRTLQRLTAGFASFDVVATGKAGALARIDVDVFFLGQPCARARIEIRVVDVAVVVAVVAGDDSQREHSSRKDCP